MKTKPTVLLLGMALAVSALTAAEPPAAFTKNARILFQGDSITDGNRGRGTDPNHILGHSYVFLIGARFGADFPERNFEFINRGVSGNTVLDLEKRWQKETLDLKPDLLSVLIGVNDSSHGVPPDQYEQVYDKLRLENERTASNLGARAFSSAGRSLRSSRRSTARRSFIFKQSLTKPAGARLRTTGFGTACIRLTPASSSWPTSGCAWCGSFGNKMRGNFREWSVAFALALLLGVLAVKAPVFFNAKQLDAAPILLLACGASLVIICRQIDISVGSQFAVCCVLAGLAAQQGLPMILVALVAIVGGALFGAFNGLLVAGLRLPSIVVTLATMVTWREALRWWRQGEFVKNLPQGFQWFGLGQTGGQIALLAITALVFLALVFALKHLAGGRFIYAVGSDAEAARLAGIHPQLVTFLVFVLMGALAGLAALLSSVRFPDVDPKSGTGHELKAIAAAVVGGVAISGGRGKLWGVLAGALLLAFIAPALVFLGAQAQWEKAIQGTIILLAVAADGWRQRREQH
jgi:rhamnose transport system permease protein